MKQKTLKETEHGKQNVNREWVFLACDQRQCLAHRSVQIIMSRTIILNREPCICIKPILEFMEEKKLASSLDMP